MVVEEEHQLPSILGIAVLVVHLRAKLVAAPSRALANWLTPHSRFGKVTPWRVHCRHELRPGKRKPKQRNGIFGTSSALGDSSLDHQSD